MSLRTPPILWIRQDRHFYFRLFLLSRKASNAITRLPKAHNNVNMPMKIERISKAVIHATSLPMYSGKPVIRCWEATTLSWVLSYGLLHCSLIQQKHKFGVGNHCFRRTVSLCINQVLAHPGTDTTTLADLTPHLLQCM